MSPPVAASAAPIVYEVDVVVDCDNEYFLQFGSVAATKVAAQNHVNLASAIFESTTTSSWSTKARWCARWATNTRRASACPARSKRSWPPSS